MKRVTFNVLPQFTQFIYYPPLVFYYFIVLHLNVYFNSFLLYFIVCISSCNFV